jgi:hypothetical protein
MSNTLPEAGEQSRYQARISSKVVVEPKYTGSVMVRIPYVLVNAGFNFSGVYQACIIQKDGTPSKKTIETLAKIFRLETPEDVFGSIQDIDPNETNAPEFELANWYEDDYGMKPKYLNTLGGGMRMPDPASKKVVSDLAKKFGSRVKAILATVDHSAEPETTDAEPEPEKEEKPSSAPARHSGGAPVRRNTGAQARTSTQDECWEVYFSKHPKPKNFKGDWAQSDEMYKGFWDETVEQTVPGKNGELSIQEWGKVRDAIDAAE